MIKNYLFWLLICSMCVHNTALLSNAQQQKEQQKISMATYLTQKANPLNWTIMNPHKDPKGFFITASTISVILICSAHIYKKYNRAKTCTENISDVWKYIKSFAPQTSEDEKQITETHERALAHLREQKQNQ